jgi:hypothetical protein
MKSKKYINKKNTIKLSNDQENALNNFNYFLNSNLQTFKLLGSAGVGKTYISNKFIERCIDYITDKIISDNLEEYFYTNVECEYCFENKNSDDFDKRLCECDDNKKILIYVLAPTHQALNIIKQNHIQNININFGQLRIVYETVSKFLNKKARYNDDGKLEYILPDKFYDKKTPFIFIDEISMVGINDGNLLLDFIENNPLTKLILFGDKCQLPPVEKGQQKNKKLLNPTDSDTESNDSYDIDENILLINQKVDKEIEMNEIMRLGKELDENKNILLDTFLELRENIKNDCKTMFYNFKNNTIYSRKEFEKKLKQEFDNDSIVLTFSNKSVDSYNKLLRNNNKYNYSKNDRIILSDMYECNNNKNNKIRYYSCERGKIISDIYQKEYNSEYFENTFKVLEFDIEIDRKRKEGNPILTVNTIDEDNKDKFDDICKQKRLFIKKKIQLLRELQIENNEIISNFYEKDNFIFDDIETIKNILEINNSKSLKNIIDEYNNDLWNDYYTNKKLLNCPIRHCYCTTIYKSQGMTYSTVYIDLVNIYQVHSSRGDYEKFWKSLYTAASRTSSKIIVFQPYVYRLEEVKNLYDNTLCEFINVKNKSIIEIKDNGIKINDLIRWKCSKGIIFERKLEEIKKGKLCNCCKWKNEEICRNLLNEIFGSEFKKIRPTCLINPKTGENLELDGFSEEHNIAFEYNGIQHYEMTPFFHKTQEDFIKQQERDKIKKELCCENNIKLIIIPYSFTYKKLEFLENFLYKQIQQLGIELE